MPTTDDAIIRRRDDGSIDLDHYESIARTLRAREQRAALESSIAPVNWLFGAPWLRARAYKNSASPK